MSTEVKGTVDRVLPIGTPTTGVAPTTAANDSAGFRRLLERLESLREPASPPSDTPAEHGLEDFARAMRDAERDHATMQEVRESLLEAWRSRTS